MLKSNSLPGFTDKSLKASPIFMEKEKTSAGINNAFAKSPAMFAIKGGQEDMVPPSFRSMYAELKKITGVADSVTLQIHLPLENKFQRFIKRSIDILVSAVIVITVLSWIIPLIALLIKLDSKGPVFLFQKRNKRGGKIFTSIKFGLIIEKNEADMRSATANDERMTGFGRFLRYHHLDKLPQFFNVLIGDMSLIGPKPHLVSDNNKYEELIEYYDCRHRVKPGITGLSQIIGHMGETRKLQAMKDCIVLDIFYVRHWSFRLDIKILWHTLRKLTVI